MKIAPDPEFESVAARVRSAYTKRTAIAPPSSTDPAFDLAAAYAVQRELVNERRASGARTVGVKVGYANRALWRALKLQTLVWAPMYDDTVRDEPSGDVALPIARMLTPRIEPEIVFKLARPIDPNSDGAGALRAVEWLAPGFEIVDSPYADAKFQPADFVAAYGFHAGLVVGPHLAVNASNVEELAAALPQFTVRLFKDDSFVAEGSGRQALRSPALCLAELAAAMSRQPGGEPLQAGDLVSSGSLTDAQPIAARQTWRADVQGIPLQSVGVRIR